MMPMGRSFISVGVRRGTQTSSRKCSPMVARNAFIDIQQTTFPSQYNSVCSSDRNSFGPYYVHAREFNSSSFLFANKHKGRSSTQQQSKPKRNARKKNFISKENKQSKEKTPKSNLFRKMADPIKKHQEDSQKKVPPAYLVRTASPNVYIAKSAIMDDMTGEVFVDPMSLYSELSSSSDSSGSANKSTQKRRSVIPHVFRQSHLQYFSPADFPNHEPPTDGTPEVAFLGRSNTGKSSLINALHSLILRGGGGVVKNNGSGGGELARTSKTPGRTQTINYFGLVPNVFAATPKGKAKLFLVDLPGFGYASAPDESVDEWQKRTQQFLISRTLPPEERVGVQPWPANTNDSISRSTIIYDGSPPLKRLYLLLDSRLPEPTLLDLSVMGWCDDYKIPYTIVLTKVDGTTRAHCVKLTNQLCMRYHSKLLHHTFSDHDEDEDDETVFMDPVVHWTSAKDGLGMEELLLSVESILFTDDGDDDDESEMFEEGASSGRDLEEDDYENKAR